MDAQSGGKDEDQDLERTICFCHNVSLGRLLEAIRNGATTIYDIQSETCASTGCGGCEYEVLEILETELKKGGPDLK